MRLSIAFLGLFMVLASGYQPLSAQDINWTRQFGTASNDFGWVVSVDSSAIYLAGGSAGSLAGANAGSYDAFVRKYDHSGTQQWTRQFGTSGFDWPYGVAAHPSGIYVAGSVPGPLPAQTHAGSSDAFARGYDSDGNELWTRQFGTTGNDEAFDIGVGPAGVYVCGTTAESLPGSTSAGQSDAFLRKYDFLGNELWTRQFGTTSREEAFAMGIDGSTVYVAGSTSGDLAGSGNAGAGDVYARKYDSDGNEIWTVQFGSSAFDGADEIAADATGVYIVGFTGGALPGQTSSGGSDAFLCRYDVDGNRLWIRQFGTVSFDESLGVDTIASGVYISGLVSGVLPGQTSAGSDDAFVRKYDVGGNEIWTHQFGTPASDYGWRLTVHSTGLYLAGETFGDLGQTSAGLSDAFLTKLRIDQDADGIFDPVDTQPAIASGDFSDLPAGGTTTGTVTDRGDQLLTVTDSVLPSPDDGVAVAAALSGGPTPATVTASGTCSPTVPLFLDAGDEVVLTCGSLIIGVVQGPVDVQLGPDLMSVPEATVVVNDLPDGSFTVEVPAGDDSVVVLVNGDELVLDPDTVEILGRIPVEIDIKPGSDSNCVNNDGHGTIPVAILSRSDFTATDIQPETVQLEGMAVRVAGKSQKLLAHTDDVNADGFEDLVVQIEDADGTLIEGSGTATLTGNTLNGTPIVGSDGICVVPPDGGGGSMDSGIQVPFRRGDANADGDHSLADAVQTLSYLFTGDIKPPCMKALDVDDSGQIGLGDPVRLLNFLFSGGPPPTLPFLACGIDETKDELSCELFEACD